MNASGYPTILAEAHVKGVSEALKNLTEAGATDPVVKATIAVSESGFASISEVVAYGEIKDESISGKLKSLFGAGLSASETETDSEHEPAARTDGAASETSTAAAAANSSETKEKEKAVVKDTIPLEVETTFSSLAPMTQAQKRTARSRCVDVCLVDIS